MDVPAKDYVKAPSSNYIDLVSLRISKELGRGGFASCWAATYNGRNVAVKVLKARPKTVTSKARIGGANGADAGHVVTRKLPNDDDDLYDRMFLREAQLMMKLEHRHLVRCFGVTRLPAGSIPRQPEPALAMLLELCEVNTIRDLITQSMTSGRRVYKEKQAYVWLLQVASALAHLHNQKPPVIHRDIKPDNVLLCRDYSDGGGSSELICKITDLGLHVAISEDRPAMLRRSMKHPAFNVKQQNTPPPPCNTPPPAGNTPAATSAAAAAAVATPAASASIVAVAGGSSLPSTPKRTSPPLRRQASSITAIGSNGCQAAAAVAAGIADESSDGMENVERSPFLKVSAGPSFASSPRPAKREATNTCCWVRDELGMSLDGATSGAVSPIVQQPSYSSGANSQADGIGATNNNNYCTNNVNEPAALKPKPELDPTQLGKVLPQQQPQQQQGGQQGGQQQQQQQQQHNREFEMYGDGNQATSSARPVGLLSASEKLSALLMYVRRGAPAHYLTAANRYLDTSYG
ncbi:hypothetical protein Vretifemale_8236 [Volvox reticuliferus]|uniref:Protein kinase domain-containing protein n=1 Tax=Volvox reticuliferus TaxID=1737510 RepID=A0A8J4CDD7_9CHLO|nr:hypothetical protein Vretifemale_8236 [Volvox reticuliferus]